MIGEHLNEIEETIKDDHLVIFSDRKYTSTLLNSYYHNLL